MPVKICGNIFCWTSNNFLSFSVRPRILEMDRKFDIKTEPGTQVEAVCETDTANPAPTIQWKRNGIMISNDDLVTITNTEIPGDYNANYSRSTLSLIATAEDIGAEFYCVLLDQSLSSSKTHFRLKCKYST